MIYKLIDSTRYLQGLPVFPELDDGKLSEEQKALLKQAVEIGIYVPVVAKKKDVENDSIPVKKN